MEEAYRKLRNEVMVRTPFVGCLFLSLPLFEDVFHFSFPTPVALSLWGLCFFTFIPYLALGRRYATSTRFHVLRLSVDVLATSVIVRNFGSYEFLPTCLLFLFNILFATYWFNLRGVFVTANVVAAIFDGLIYLEYHGLIPHNPSMGVVLSPESLRPLFIAIWLFYNLASLTLFFLFSRLQEARDVIARQNADLERRIRERTRELETTNERLRLANHDLMIAMGELETGTRRTEAELSEEAAMGRVVANLAHTFQGPLVPFATFLRGLQEDDTVFKALEEDYGEDIPVMLRKIEDLTRICRFVLELPQTGVPHDLGEIAVAVADSLRSEAAQQGKDVEIKVLADDVPPIEGSRSDLFLALYEPGINALRAMGPSGRLWIRVREETTDDGSCWSVLSISDDGPGMDSGRLRNMFKVYTSSNPGGLRGVGLYLVDKAVRRLGGEVHVTSSPGKGTLFVLRFPRSAT